jgi:predicted PurR-regulated permease PerM
VNEKTQVATGTPGARILVLALGAAVVFLLLPYVAGLLGAMVLYVVSAPFLKRIQPGRSRSVAAFFTVFLMFFVLVLPGAWLLAELLAQVPEAAESLQRSAAVQKLMATEIGAVSLDAHLRNASSAIVAWSSRQTMSVLGSVMGATLNLVIALFGTYYLLTSAPEIWTRVKPLLPLDTTRAELLRRRFHRVTEAMLLGVVFAGAAQGIIVGVSFGLIGFEAALLWGAVTAVVSILPMFGSGIVWGPAALVLLAQHRFGAALFLALLGIVVISNVDNVLRLVVYRRVSQIHPMVTLVGAFAGARALGLAGLLLGPLVLSYAIEFLAVHERDMGLRSEEHPGPGQGFPGSPPALSPTPAATSAR